MTFHHRHKQRTLAMAAWIIIFTIAVDVFFMLKPILSDEVALLYAFAVAVGLTVAYQTYHYRHSHEHHVLVNTLTQIYLGAILFVSAVVMLLLHAFFGIDVIDSYLVLSLMVILLTFLSLGLFDMFLKQELKRKFPMSETPSPKKAGRKR